ncbi:MAG: ComEC/Rec2 family competence protein [Bacteroidia bacterium]
MVVDSVHATIAQAMFLGDKNGMGREVKNAYSIAGTSHILAISGLHVGIVFLVLSRVLSFLHLIPQGLRIKNIVILGLLLGYMLLTGASPAVVRSVLMFGIVLIMKVLYLRYNLLNVVGTAALLQLFFEPEIAFDVGFQLSYLAVIGIITGFPVWERIVGVENFWLKLVSSWIGVTICATLGTLPLVIMHFGRFPTYFLLSNILVSTLAFLLVLVGFFTVIFCYVPLLGEWLGYFCSVLIGYLQAIVLLVGDLPFPVIEKGIGMQGIGIILIQLGLAAIFPLSGLLRKSMYGKKY